MKRTTRLQAAIVERHHVLLVQHREHRSGRAYWLLPGGAAEDQESDEAALRREIEEETSLGVAVARLLFDDPVDNDAVYSTSGRICAGRSRAMPLPALNRSWTSLTCMPSLRCTGSTCGVRRPGMPLSSKTGGCIRRYNVCDLLFTMAGDRCLRTQPRWSSALNGRGLASHGRLRDSVRRLRPCGAEQAGSAGGRR
jgi:hypothetical protein